VSINYLSAPNLTLGYENSIVIDDLELSLDDSKDYQIIGGNGAGKSTLLNFISNNFHGNIFDSTVELKKVRILEISSDFTLIENLSLLENCMYFTKNTISEKDVYKALDEYEITPFKNDLLHKFSSGMIKRSELAIAMLINPDVLCIDEPLNYLDKKGSEILAESLKKRSNDGRSTILSSQEPLNLFIRKCETIDLNV